MRAANQGLLPRPLSGGCLRRLRRADLRAFQSYRSNPELGRYQGWSPLSDAEALAFLSEMESSPFFQPGHWVQLGIADASGEALLGDIGVHLSADGRTGEVGYTLAPAAQGRGLATAAVRESLQLIFAATEVESVLGITDARNQPSIRLLERLGFAWRDARDVIFRGEQCRELVYVLTRAPR
jgi:RimJ/RimL family protein N-acetyltransferase